jgi:hypothetical protein
MRRRADWEHWLLILSDVHFDSVKCDRELLTKHLDQAKERCASIISTGDFFDLMQGKLDPRQAKDELREEYMGGDYLDLVIDDAAEFLRPYAPYFLMMGDGNHETSVRRRVETCPTSRLLQALCGGTKHKIKHGHYAGWLQMQFKGESRAFFTINLHYHHGSGLKSKVSHHRRGMICPDAHIMTYGHYHECWFDMLARYRIDHCGVIRQDKQLHLGIPGYKDDVKEGAGGWAIEKNLAPQPRGAWWVRFSYHARATGWVNFEPHMAC